MTDLYDIKIDVFQFLYNYNYLIFVWILLFLFLFYVFLYFVLNYDYKMNKKIELIEDDFLKERFENIYNNISIDRSIFYRELSIFLKYLILKEYKINNWDIFYMTYSQMKDNFRKSNYIDIFEEVYFLEFDMKKDENIDLRRNLLSKINI